MRAIPLSLIASFGVFLTVFQQHTRGYLASMLIYYKSKSIFLIVLESKLANAAASGIEEMKLYNMKVLQAQQRRNMSLKPIKAP